MTLSDDALCIWRPWATPAVVLLLCYFGYKMLRQLQVNTRLYSANSSGFDKLVASVLPLKNVMPFMAILFLILPDFLKDGPSPAPMPILGAAIAVASLAAAWKYEHHQSSVRGLLALIDVALLTLGTALPVGALNLARQFAQNYALYRDHADIYAAVVLASGLVVLFTNVPRRIRRQVVTLQCYVETGLTSGQLYDVLTAAKGSKEAINNWGPGRFAGIMAPLAVLFIIAGSVGGADYVLYACFLLILPVAGFVVSLAMIRRGYILKLLGTQDVVILDRRPELRP